jgi:serine phosphatase RsbU (regulator of sigma subunit)/Flp pilus assembly protein TadD
MFKKKSVIYFNTVGSVLLLFLVLATVANTFAQQSKIDSLLLMHKTAIYDSTKFKYLNNIAWEYQRISSYDSALKYANMGIEFAKKTNQEAKTPRLYNCIGVVYKNKGNYSKALENYFKGLKLADKHEDDYQKSGILANIGGLYLIKGKNAEAEHYFYNAYTLAEKSKNKKTAAKMLATLSNISKLNGNFTLSRSFLFKALKRHKELDNKDDIVECLENIGVLYHEEKDYNTALKYYSDALTLANKNQNKKQISDLYGNIAQIYFCRNDDLEAEKYFLKAISISDSIKLLQTQMANLIGLSKTYERMGKINSSFEAYKKAVDIKDSLFNKSKIEEIARQEMNYEFEKKEEQIRLENEQKNYKQKLITWAVSIGLLLVIVFTLFILKTLATTKKQKQLIELKNKETEEQKKIIEEKNKDITDSINYAKQIQRALLREEEHVSSHLPEHAILFMPKDIVSGDFYWATEKEDYWYFAVADCTGHGVPGAIMSMLGISFLNDISFSEKLLSPNEILNKLRDRIVSELRQGDESIGNRDGMDISLCRLNLKTLELLWAGANNSLNLIRNGHLEIIKADKQPIGYYPNPKPFTNHTIQLQKGDSIYIYSDGYADQFGGEKGKKLTYKRLENLLIEKSALPLKEQKVLLKKAFIDWKGSLEQVDDVCMVGVRV